MSSAALDQCRWRDEYWWTRSHAMTRQRTSVVIVKKVYITHVIVFAQRHVARSNASNIKARGADESQSYEKINEISAQRAGLEKGRLGQIGEGGNGMCGRHAKEVWRANGGREAEEGAKGERTREDEGGQGGGCRVSSRGSTPGQEGEGVQMKKTLTLRESRKRKRSVVESPPPEKVKKTGKVRRRSKWTAMNQVTRSKRPRRGSHRPPWAGDVRGASVPTTNVCLVREGMVSLSFFCVLVLTALLEWRASPASRRSSTAGCLRRSRSWLNGD